MSSLGDTHHHPTPRRELHVSRLFFAKSASFCQSAACGGLNRFSGLLFTRLQLFRDSSVGRAGDC